MAFIKNTIFLSYLKAFFFILFCLIASSSVLSQSENLIEVHSKKNFFISASLGAQMSGIKSEDFVSSNYSPLLNFSAGKWFVPYLALAIGYRGYYFYYIMDNHKHFYNYYYGEAIFNLNKLFYPNKKNQFWCFEVQTGAGYFYNYFYKQPNICASFALTNSLQVNNKVKLSLSVNSIMGWDIYQGNKDILPGLSFGVAYSFKP